MSDQASPLPRAPAFVAPSRPPARPGPARRDLQLTLGIVTKNRHEPLRRCLESLALIGDAIAQVIVIDDTSESTLDQAVGEAPSAIAGKLRLVRQHAHEGYIVARNRIMREAATDYVLLMDDDAWLLDGGCIGTALSRIDACPRIGAVACAMAGADGTPWDGSLQPAAVNYPCVVPSFIGFAHLLRRHLFLHLGGYREAFHSYGEEKDYCLRLMDAGFDVVYLPDVRVVHAPHDAGRLYATYLRRTIRNDCLTALYNEPFPLPLVTVPIRLLRYRRMRGPVERDPGGLQWIVRELAGRFPEVLADRRPVTWATMRKWRRVRRDLPRTNACEGHKGGV